MLTLILKDLRSFSNNSKYLIIQFVVFTILVFLFFIATIEFYAQAIDTQQNRIPLDVGSQTYSVINICIFLTLFLIPKHAVESVEMECSKIGYRQYENCINSIMLKLTPMANWKILCGKIAAVVIWALSGICLTIPLFVLSIYIGGLPLMQLVKSGTVLFFSCIFFALIGFVFAAWLPPIRAKGISYIIILAFIFLPLLPITPFNSIPLFEVLNPFSALLTILQSDISQLWIWNTCFLCGLSLLMSSLLIRICR